MKRLVLFVILAGVGVSCRDPQTARRRYLESGDAYRSKGMYAEASVQYRNALAIEPRDADTHVVLADVFGRLHDRNNALSEYLRAADVAPDRVDLQINAGRLLLVAGQFTEAKALADRVLARHPKDAEALILAGNAVAGLRGYDSAIGDIERAVREDPGESRFYSVLGVYRLAKGDRGRAESSFRRAVEANPASIDARLALGNFYWSTDRIEDAREWLSSAWKLDPRGVPANRALALFSLATGRVREAQPYLETAAFVSGNAGATVVLADYYVKTGQPDRAVPLLKAVLAAPLAPIDAKAQVAAIQYDMGRHAEAYRTAEMLAGQAPTEVAPLLVKARLLAADGKPADLLAVLRRAVSTDAQSIQARLMLGNALVAAGQRDEGSRAFEAVLKLDPQNLAADLALAQLQLEAGKPTSARQHVDRALDSHPASAEARVMLADVLIANGDLARAKVEMDQLASRYPRVTVVQVKLGSVDLAMKRPDAARTAFERALALDPGSHDAVAGLARVALEQNRPAEARALVEKRVAAAPDDLQALLLAAAVYRTTGDLKASETTLRRVLGIDPNNLAAYRMLAATYLAGHRLDEARQRYEEIARREEKPVAAETMIGIILEQQNRPNEARAHFERALAIDGHAAVAANNLAWMYAEAGTDLDTALRLAETAREGLPGRPEVNDTLGWIYLKKGLANLAIPPLEQSVTAQPDSAIYHYHLAKAYAATNQKAKARAALERALGAKTGFKGEIDARQLLASLGGN